MADRTSKELYRRNPNLRYKEVKTVLPLHFQEEYPNLVTFLETYYDIEPTVKENYFRLHDLDETSLQYLDRLFYEWGNGASPDEFSDPRFIGKILWLIIQNKGNEYAAQLFFRLENQAICRIQLVDVFFSCFIRIGIFFSFTLHFSNFFFA